jgi:hypothetical protein
MLDLKARLRADRHARLSADDAERLEIGDEQGRESGAILDLRSSFDGFAAGARSAEALLRLTRDGVDHVSGRDRRLAPLGGRERIREHHLGALVHRRRERPGCTGPKAGPSDIPER